MRARQTEGRASGVRRAWLARRTNWALVRTALTDHPSSGFSAWARTTAGVAAFLLVLQMATGMLLAFYYVPSTTDAHLTVSYIEKAAGAGSWLRALHFYGSQWLPLALALHLAQMLWRGTYRRKPVGWLAALSLLALALAAGATGYSLPWDGRAFYGTRVAASIADGLPLVGATARAWLVGGAEVSTLTLSRFYALHILVIPFLIFLTITARLFLFREGTARAGAESDAPSIHRRPAAAVAAERIDAERIGEAGPRDDDASHDEWRHGQLARNAAVIAFVFGALAACAARWPAPLGPAAGTAAPGYLPRPGAQFLWLFQMLKYLPVPLASLAALLVPGLLLGALALLPFLAAVTNQGDAKRPYLKFGSAVFALGALLFTGMTALAYLEDARDPAVREQLARQAQAEEAFRSAPFAPRLSSGTAREGEIAEAGANTSRGRAPGEAEATAATMPPPAAYVANCAKCHGAHAEGKSIYPQLIGVSARPRRSVDDLIAIMNDPRRYGLESRMPSFAAKLSAEEKRAIAAWLSTLTP